MPTNLGSVNAQRLQYNAVLSSVAQGYVNPALVCKYAMPPVNVGSRGGLIATYGDDIFDYVDDARSPGGQFPEVVFGYGTQPFSLASRGLLVTLPEEIVEEAGLVGLNLSQKAPDVLMKRAALALEIEQSRILFNPANYPVGHAETKTADFWDAVDPEDEIVAIKEVISGKVGEDPNVVILGRVAFDKIRTNQAIRDRIRYSSRAGYVQGDMITAEMIAAMWGLKRLLVASALWKNPATGMRERIVGNFAWFGYVNPRAIATPSGELIEIPIGPLNDVSRVDPEPAFGYTYTLNGQPRVSNRFFDEKTDSHYHKIKYERKPVVANPESGYLVTNPVNPA